MTTTIVKRTGSVPSLLQRAGLLLAAVGVVLVTA